MMVTQFRRVLAAMAVLILTAVLPAAAQVQTTSVDELRRALSRGDIVSIVQKDGAGLKGNVVRVEETALRVHVRDTQVDSTVPLSAIQSLERTGDSVRNGTLIGAVAGGAPVAAMFVYAMAVDRNEMDEWAGAYAGMGALFAGIGALVGMALDAAHDKPPLRFDAPSSRTLAIRVSPILTRANRGVMVSVVRAQLHHCRLQ